MPVNFAALTSQPVFFLGKSVNLSTISYPDVIFYQRLLRIEGLYHGQLDGLWGPLTQAASEQFFEAGEKIAENVGTFDSRTEKCIRSLQTKTQVMARKFMNEVMEADMKAEIRIISGTRTYAEQNDLFSQGRTRRGRVVTRLRGGQSYHNFGIAWDIGAFSKSGRYLVNPEHYKKAHSVSDSSQLEWGGNWSMLDYSHFQLININSIASLRSDFEVGRTTAIA